VTERNLDCPDCLHLVLDHEGYLPCFAVITEGKVADVTVAQGLTFEPGHDHGG
jgi:hypothetical protein